MAYSSVKITIHCRCYIEVSIHGSKLEFSVAKEFGVEVVGPLSDGVTDSSSNIHFSTEQAMVVVVGQLLMQDFGCHFELDHFDFGQPKLFSSYF